MQNQSYILVYASNEIGFEFLQALRKKELPFAVISVEEEHRNQLINMGVQVIWSVDFKTERRVFPEDQVSKIVLFEDNLANCIRLLQITQNWTTGPVYVVCGSTFTSKIYKDLGAQFVVHSNGKDVSFLIG